MASDEETISYVDRKESVLESPPARQISSDKSLITVTGSSVVDITSIEGHGSFSCEHHVETLTKRERSEVNVEIDGLRETTFSSSETIVSDRVRTIYDRSLSGSTSSVELDHKERLEDVVYNPEDSVFGEHAFIDGEQAERKTSDSYYISQTYQINTEEKSSKSVTAVRSVSFRSSKDVELGEQDNDNLSLHFVDRVEEIIPGGSPDVVGSPKENNVRFLWYDNDQEDAETLNRFQSSREDVQHLIESTYMVSDIADVVDDNYMGPEPRHPSQSTSSHSLLSDASQNVQGTSRKSTQPTEKNNHISNISSYSSSEWVQQQGVASQSTRETSRRVNIHTVEASETVQITTAQSASSSDVTLTSDTTSHSTSDNSQKSQTIHYSQTQPNDITTGFKPIECLTVGRESPPILTYSPGMAIRSYALEELVDRKVRITPDKMEAEAKSLRFDEESSAVDLDKGSSVDDITSLSMHSFNQQTKLQNESYYTESLTSLMYGAASSSSNLVVQEMSRDEEDESLDKLVDLESLLVGYRFHDVGIMQESGGICNLAFDDSDEQEPAAGKSTEYRSSSVHSQSVQNVNVSVDSSASWSSSQMLTEKTSTYSDARKINSSVESTLSSLPGATEASASFTTVAQDTHKLSSGYQTGSVEIESGSKTVNINDHTTAFDQQDVRTKTTSSTAETESTRTNIQKEEEAAKDVSQTDRDNMSRTLPTDEKDASEAAGTEGSSDILQELDKFIEAGEQAILKLSQSLEKLDVEHVDDAGIEDNEKQRKETEDISSSKFAQMQHSIQVEGRSSGLSANDGEKNDVKLVINTIEVGGSTGRSKNVVLTTDSRHTVGFSETDNRSHVFQAGRTEYTTSVSRAQSSTVISEAGGSVRRIETETSTHNIEAGGGAIRRVDAESRTHNVEAGGITKNIETETTTRNIEAGGGAVKRFETETSTHNIEAGGGAIRRVDAESRTHNVEAGGITKNIETETTTRNIEAGGGAVKRFETETSTHNIEAGGGAIRRVDAESRTHNVEAGGITKNIETETTTRNIEAGGGAVKRIETETSTHNIEAGGGAIRRVDAESRTHNVEAGGITKNIENETTTRNIEAGGGAVKRIETETYTHNIEAGGGAIRRVDAESRTHNIEAGGITKNIDTETTTRNIEAGGGAVRRIEAESRTHIIEAGDTTRRVEAESTTHNIEAGDTTRRIEAESTTHIIEAGDTTKRIEAESATHNIEAGDTTRRIEAESTTHIIEAGDTTRRIEAEMATHIIEAGDTTKIIEAESATHNIEAGDTTRRIEAQSTTHIIEAGGTTRRIEAEHTTHNIEAGGITRTNEAERTTHNIEAGGVASITQSEIVTQKSELDNVTSKKKADKNARKRKADNAGGKKKNENVANTKKADNIASTRKSANAKSTKKGDKSKNTTKADNVEIKQKADSADRTKQADNAESARNVETVERTKHADKAEITRNVETVERTKHADKAEITRNVETVERTKHADKAEITRNVETVERTKHADKAEITRNIETVERTKHADKAEITGNVETVERTKHADKAEITRNVETVERTKHADKAEITRNVETVERTKHADKAEITRNVETVERTKHADKAEITRNIETVERTKHADKAEITGNVETVERTKHADKAEITRNIETVERTKHADKAEITGNIETVERTKHADKAEITRDMETVKRTKQTDKAEITKNTNSSEITIKTDHAEITRNTDIAESTKSADSEEITRKTDSTENKISNVGRNAETEDRAGIKMVDTTATISTSIVAGEFAGNITNTIICSESKQTSRIFDSVDSTDSNLNLTTAQSKTGEEWRHLHLTESNQKSEIVQSVQNAMSSISGTEHAVRLIQADGTAQLDHVLNESNAAVTSANVREYLKENRLMGTTVGKVETVRISGRVRVVGDTKEESRATVTVVSSENLEIASVCVTRRFNINSKFEASLKSQGATLKSESMNIDVYYDNADFDLTLADCWLRCVNSKWQLHSNFTKLLNKQTNNQYTESEDKNTIVQSLATILKCSVPADDDDDGSTIAMFVQKSGLREFVRYTTINKTYTLGDLIIDLVLPEYGFWVGSVTVASSRKIKLHEAVGLIDSFWKTTGSIQDRISGLTMLTVTMLTVTI